MSADAAWELTRAITPRATVRVAAVDAYGHALNLYSGFRHAKHSTPGAPWAVYLADQRGGYRLLGFDFDTKNGNAGQDAAVLRDVLGPLGIAHVVCRSGPSGGRHVWIALTEAVAAETVAQLAYLVREIGPSLDVAPLTNARTGCLRPPGAPHRAGSNSIVVEGDVDNLRRPSTTPADVDALLTTLARLAPSASRSDRDAAPRRGTIAFDTHGRPYIPGVRRSLPGFSVSALKEPAELGDASSVLWRVLLGAAAAHWRYEDVAALADHSPGFEHVRSTRDRSYRTTRPSNGPASPHAVLVRQWGKAVQHVASRDKHPGDDPTFDGRAYDLTQVVRRVQERARAAGGRWLNRGGPADRRVFDALCLLALQSLSTDVEADIRRLALIAGIGRETARTALHRLAADGWIEQTRAPEGPHGSHWTIQPQRLLHRQVEDSRPQADPRPPGPALRSALLRELTTRLSAGAHDVFTLSPGLGLRAGQVFAFLPAHPCASGDLAFALGVSADILSPVLTRLLDVGLVESGPAGWSHVLERRDQLALLLGVAGRLQARTARYNFERELWAWWQAEQTWMEAPRRTDSSRRPRPGQTSLLPIAETNIFGAHPRRSDGRADYRRAREILLENPQGASRPIASESPTQRRRPRAA